MAAAIELSAADYAFISEEINDVAGDSIASAGDVIGASSNDDGGENAGKIYLILAP